jgi:hypothetical protein
MPMGIVEGTLISRFTTNAARRIDALSQLATIIIIASEL